MTSALPLLLGLLLGAPALAQEDDDDARARELYENGAILYEEGRYEDAIVAWEEAYRLSSRPVLLYNMANAYERLGQYELAIDALGRYRAFAKADEREALERRLRNLEERRNAAAAAPPPEPVVTDPVRADAGRGDAGRSDPGRSSGSTTAPTPLPAPRGSRSTLGLSLVGAGAAGLATGTFFGLRAISARGEAEALCVAVDGGGLCPGEASDALARDRGSALVADIAFGLGGAALAGGALTLALGQQDRVTLTPSMRGGLVVRARF